MHIKLVSPEGVLYLLPVDEHEGYHRSTHDTSHIDFSLVFTRRRASPLKDGVQKWSLNVTLLFPRFHPDPGCPREGSRGKCTQVPVLAHGGSVMPKAERGF